MPKFIKLSEEILKGQSLSVVREIGRQMGVQSPSSLSIPGLITEILKIQSGELAPVKQVKRGAPSKPKPIICRQQIYKKNSPNVTTTT